MTDLIARLAAMRGAPAPEREKCKHEIARDAGAAAYAAGEPEGNWSKQESYGYEWRNGWMGARAAKCAAFEDYLKYKHLHAEAYVAPQFRREAGYLDRIQAWRLKHIAAHEARYPDFPAAYQKHLIWKKGASK